MKKKIYLITQDYPFGNSETSFIDNEYRALLDTYDVFTLATELGENTDLNEEKNHGIIDLKVSFCKKILYALRFLVEKDAWIEIISICSERKNVLKNLARAVMYGTYAEIFFYRLRRKINLSKDTKALFYFFWWDRKCLGLTMHRKKYPQIKIIARNHGYDLFDARELYGRQYFKPQMDRELERLIFAAQYSKDYYLKRYKLNDSPKYPVRLLGVADQKPDLSVGKEKIFHILSCSSAIALKRIDLIIDGLSLIKDTEIKWVHIGDGSELENLKISAEKKLGRNIDYDFVGEYSNREVIKYYRENNVNCFITTTSTEGGNPVSIQEALSFGIPVIAVNVGDIHYMIDKNGILLSEDPSGNEIADAVLKIACMDNEHYADLRKNSYDIYCRLYNAEVNCQRFIKDLEQI